MNAAQSLSLKGQGLPALPKFVAERGELEKLDLRWNSLTAIPPWLDQLEQRGCTVFI